mgnify:FL=1
MSDTAPRQVTAYEATKQTLVAMQGQIAAQLPASIKPEKFIGAVLVALKMNADLLGADKTTFYAACLKCAQDGLLPDGREAALVMFGGKVQYMPMIGGLLKKVRNSGQVKKVSVQVVHENDLFDYELGGNDSLTHKPALTDRGEPVAAYAIAWLNDGTMLAPEVMSVEEIEKVRKVSRSGDKGPWKQWWSEMARKTVFRRLAKSLPNAADLAQVFDHDNENYDLNQPAQEKPPTAPLARLKKAIGVEVPKDPEPESTGGDLPEIPDDMKEAMR